MEETMRRLLLIALLAFATFSYQAQAQGNVNDIINDLMELLKNATKALENIDSDAKNATHIVQEYLQFFQANMPKVLEYLGSIAELPSAIIKMVDTVNHSIPIAQTCVYTLGGCVVLGSTVYLTANILKYFSNKIKSQEINRIF